MLFFGEELINVFVCQLGLTLGIWTHEWEFALFDLSFQVFEHALAVKDMWTHLKRDHVSFTLKHVHANRAVELLHVFGISRFSFCPGYFFLLFFLLEQLLYDSFVLL